MVLSVVQLDTVTPRGGPDATSVVVTGVGFGVATGTITYDPNGLHGGPYVVTVIALWQDDRIEYTSPTGYSVPASDNRFLEVHIQKAGATDGTTHPWWVPDSGLTLSPLPTARDLDYQWPNFEAGPSQDVDDPRLMQAADFNRYLDTLLETTAAGLTAATHAATDHTALPGVPAAEAFTQTVHDVEDHSAIPGVPVPVSASVHPFTGRVTPLYVWSSTAVGARLPDPSVLPVLPPGFPGGGSAWSPDGDLLVITSTTGLFIYQLSGKTFSKVGEPGLTSVNEIAWAPNGRLLAATRGTTSPRLSFFERGGDGHGVVLTALPDLIGGDIPTNNARGEVAWSPNSEFVAIAESDGTRVEVWQVDYSTSPLTFTKLSALPDLPTGNAFGVGWSRTGEFLAAAHASSPFITVWQRAGTTFTKIADPSVLPINGGTSCRWINTSDEGELLLLGHSRSGGSPPNSDNFGTVFKRVGTTLTNIATLLNPNGSNANTCAWHPSGDFCAVAHSSDGNTESPVSLFSRAGQVFTLLPQPDLPTYSGGPSGGHVEWSPDGQFLAVLQFFQTPKAPLFYQSDVDQPASGVLRFSGFQRGGL